MTVQEQIEKDAENSSGLEFETVHEFREIERTIALQPASLQELFEQMLPGMPEQVRRISYSASKEQAIVRFNSESRPVPHLTKSIWLLKIGKKSGGKIILPGGGVDIANPTVEDILQEAERELADETGHTTSNIYLRDDCTRTFSFTTIEDSPKPIRTINERKESLVVAYIPVRQNTLKRFKKENENIGMPLRLSPEEVSHLLRQETHTTRSNHTGILIDNLSMDFAAHARNGTVLNREETERTRTAIETETWIFEAQCWKRLLTELSRTTGTRKTKRMIKLMHKIMQSPDPTDIISATELIGNVRNAVHMIEQRYDNNRKPAKHRLPRNLYDELIAAKIPKEMLYKRMILMDELKVAYRATFFKNGKKSKK